MRASGYFTVLAGLLAATGAVARPATSKRLELYQYTQVHMGVPARIAVYAPDRATAERACRAAFARVAALEDVMSDYRRDSELMRLCARAGGPPVPVSRDLWRVLARGQRIARQTSGGFDITIGPMVALWRRARRSGTLPTPEELAAARRLVGWRKVRLDSRRRTVRLLAPGMRLDLGGIAKGDACDEAQNVLKQHGLRRALVEAGGDIVVTGSPPGTRGWPVEIAGAGPGGKSHVLRLAWRAISTSGDTEQFVEIGGRRYAHIVDPRTGLGLTTRATATVIARDGLTSDPLATALCVRPALAARLARRWRARAWVRRTG